MDESGKITLLPVVVRCKDCKHFKGGFCYNPNTYDDEKTRGNTVPDWFCADGERNPTQTNAQNNALVCVKGSLQHRASYKQVRKVLKINGFREKLA